MTKPSAEVTFEPKRLHLLCFDWVVKTATTYTGFISYIPECLLLDILAHVVKQKKQHLLKQSIAAIMEELTVRCAYFTQLDLSHISIKIDDMNELLSGLPNLTHLNLQGRACDEITLKMIGMHNTKLISLNLSKCSFNLDRLMEHQSSMEYLCRQVDGKPALASLEKVDLEDTAIPWKGAGMLLKSIPTIQCIKHNDMDLVFSKLSKKWMFPNLRYVNIKHFRYGTMDVPNISLKRLIKLASSSPALTSLSAYIGHDCLQPLEEFQDLRNLKLTYKAPDSDFNGMPVDSHSSLHVIQTIGSKLTSLDLTSFDVSLIKLASLCPSLEFLRLDLSQDPVWINTRSRQFDCNLPTSSEKRFSSLKRLEISDYYANLFLISHWCPNLQHLTVRKGVTSHLCDPLNLLIQSENLEMCRMPHLTYESLCVTGKDHHLCDSLTRPITVGIR